jgi:very-short-patch-repair endonuclease
LISDEWQVRRDELTQLIKAGRSLTAAYSRYRPLLIEDAWTQDLLCVRQAFVTKGNKWWRFLSSEFRQAKVRMQALARVQLSKKSDEVLQIIDTILDSQKHLKHFEELTSLGKSLFGVQWKGVESDWDVLQAITDWIIALYRDVDNGTLPSGLIGFLSSAPSIAGLRPAVENLEQLLQRHADSVTRLERRLDLALEESQHVHWSMTLAAQQLTLARWLDNLDQLERLCRFNVLSSKLLEDGLGFVVEVCDQWREETGALARLFDYSWYNGLVEKAYKEIPEIRQFDRVQHEYVRKEFSRLDHLLFRHNQARLALAHWQSLPSIGAGGEMAIVARELNKKRRILPIRSLMKSAGRAIQAIKPVFMMSPMSIATYVPPGSVEFDLVVFDEASQVKPVDGFGALLRGKQAVVVGDSKQLPPTNFFDSLLQGDDDADAEVESAGDMESILSLFLGKGAPERMLRWHYRSRHHSLIAVSNNEFYENQLVVFPSPGVNTHGRGLRVRYLPHTLYDRGKTRTNPEEAKAVAEAVMAHAREFPDMTLGVVAFSVAQRDAIEIQLERLRRLDESCEPFFATAQHEPFFIKNLENVQGDERDVIFISIGYGRADAGYMTMNFGPLNRDGGERRLNVLISRSRLAMDVFCNFTSADLDLARTNARAIVALKNFLAYAETGLLERPSTSGREPDSAFEQAVVRALAGRGYEVDPQVGTAGFFIDIGVRHPERPGDYVIGIECDGATYHSSRSARDRDRLRQEILEGLGWRLHRIWSTDWYRNPKAELDRAIAAIEQERTLRRYETSTVSNAATREASAAIKRATETRGALTADTTSYPPYTKFQFHLRVDGFELHEADPESLVESVKHIVIAESPVHKMEVMRRITEAVGLKRTGHRIQSTLQAAINFASSRGRVRVAGDFLWDPEMKDPPVRDRSALEANAKKLELVAPEEIRAALLAEIRKGFSMNIEDAISNAANALGFQRVTIQAQNVFREQIRSLIDDGQLKQSGEMLSPNATA